MTWTPTSPELVELAQGLTTVAVTGTNGKTSTTSMIAAIVAAAGEPCARVTTLGMWVDAEQTADDGSLESFTRTVRRAHERGVRTLALEVTSRALEAGFAMRWPAHIAVFTNLTHEHLDLHGTPERYLAAKAQLFMHLRRGGSAVMNALDPAAKLLCEVLPQGTRLLGFALASARASLPVALAAERLRCSERGTQLELAAGELARCLGGCLELRVLGEFQADNALAAALAAHAAGYPPHAIKAGLEGFAGVSGRLEPCSRAPLVLVDFAHTPDALRRTLETARKLAHGRAGRLGCVFGCGGQRDTQKRPQMGGIAAECCDAVWLTTDNPRSEDPEQIADMVLAGAAQVGTRGRARWTRQPDRSRAVTEAVLWAAPADVVVVAGRGHEREQQLALGCVSLSDRELVHEALTRRAP